MVSRVLDFGLSWVHFIKGQLINNQTQEFFFLFFLFMKWEDTI